ncbi:hypothetical protein [Agrococcus jejuensis]|uniref:DUF3558 domain-containing protein n=1 Tax=Agrococcus jejuensis TaxID=399736 RepID=A0A1G8AQ07_9MICO|nr:hypothetical protein [Agrococcus jejuensis]SDH22944.1 hypothetical protein SAMN04489720_0480 [Agrococcus jejuensis]
MRGLSVVPLALVLAVTLVGCSDGGDEAAPSSSAPTSVAPDGPGAPSATPDAGGVDAPIAQEDIPGCEEIDAVLLAALPAGSTADAAGQSFDDPSVDVEGSCGYRANGALVQVTVSAIPFTDDELAALSTGPTVRASATGDAAGLLVMTSDEMGDDAEWLNGSVLAFDGAVSVSITARDQGGERTVVPEALTIGAATDAAVAVHDLVG